MEFNSFIRKPFVTEACQITEENIEEMAELLGELKTNDAGEKYIEINRRRVPHMHTATVGCWVTKFGKQLRCFSPKVFLEQFTPLPQDGRYFWIHDVNDVPVDQMSFPDMPVEPEESLGILAEAEARYEAIRADAEDNGRSKVEYAGE